MPIIYIAIISLFIGACSAAPSSWVHRIDIQQGNIITQEMVDQLKIGMSAREVKFVMGSPLIVDPFHRDRWDYIYSLQPNDGAREQRRVTLFFTDDKLARIEGSVKPRADAKTSEDTADAVVTVPTQPEQPGYFKRLWERIGGDHEVADPAN